MYKYLPITDVYAREILDSRGNPTIEVEVLAGDEFCGRASVPSGASTGKYEAVELRDKEERYGGLGVQQAADHVNARIAPEVIGMNVLDRQRSIRRWSGLTEQRTNPILVPMPCLESRWRLQERRPGRWDFRCIRILAAQM